MSTTTSDRPHDSHGHDPHSAESKSADGPIADLIRLAGHRPQPSARATREAMAAVTVEWERTVRRRRLRRSFWGLAAASVVMLALVWVARLSFHPGPIPRSMPPVVANVVSLREPVRVRQGDSQAYAIDAGDGVSGGSIIDTGGGGRAAFRLRDGTSLRLDVDTQIVLESASRLRLMRGAAYVDSNGRNAADVQIQTTQGTVREIGTQFEVRTTGFGIRIRVREGDVRLDRRNLTVADAPLFVRQAEEVRVRAGGGVERRAIARYGPEWAWVEAIAPPFAIDGASLESFLHWVSRETGWTWRFKDDAAAGHGSTVVLHGSIDGLTPGEALDAVLPTCAMTSQLHDGQLIVSVASP